MAISDEEWDDWSRFIVDPKLCRKDDPYDGPHKVYPARHGSECPGHYDWNEFREWSRNPDNRPRPNPRRFWGRWEDVVEVDERYL